MPLIIGRRELIAALGGAAVRPLAAHAQGKEARRVGVLMNYPESDPAGQLRARAFQQGLEERGWTVDRNLRIDYLWGTGDADWMRSAVEQVLRPPPDAILANADTAVRAAHLATRTVPVIFIGGGDPVALGWVQSLARPGGNLTGFTVQEPSLGPKMLELLEEIAPRVRRVGLMFNPNSVGNRQTADATAAAISAVEVVPSPVRELPADIDAAMTKLGRDPNLGLMVLPEPAINSHRKLIIELSARHQLPAIHGLRAATADGALMSYGVDLPDLFRRAAAYVDRILRGDKPADLPVQRPTKFELVINLKTAKAFGITVPASLLARADELIE
jgi:putative tryptophan/tyrosine transport system substrate-binding protein